jgi:hypothetical protein
VQKLASEAVDTLRKQEVGLLGGAPEGRTLKKSRWALLKNPWNLTQRQGQKLSEGACTNQRLYRAYLLKERQCSSHHGDDSLVLRRAVAHSSATNAELTRQRKSSWGRPCRGSVCWPNLSDNPTASVEGPTGSLLSC